MDAKSNTSASDSTTSSLPSRFGHIPYPKITGKNKEFVRQLRLLKQRGCLPYPKVTIEGTVKLHGMHADIVYDLSGLVITREITQPTGEHVTSASTDLVHNTSRLAIYTDTDKHIDSKTGNSATACCPTDANRFTIVDPTTTPHEFLQRITFQSRNRICLPTESTHLFPHQLTRHPHSLRHLRNQILTRHQTLHPTTTISTIHPLLLAGEWIGSKVQPSIALRHLTPRFVILGVHLNNVWQPAVDYADIEARDADVYSLFRVPVYRVEWDVRDLSERNPVLTEMQRLADEVAECCPYARHFGAGVEQQRQQPGQRGSMENLTSKSADKHRSGGSVDAAARTTTTTKQITPAYQLVQSKQPTSINGEGIVWHPAVPAARADPATWLKMKGVGFTASLSSSAAVAAAASTSFSSADLTSTTRPRSKSTFNPGSVKDHLSDDCSPSLHLPSLSPKRTANTRTETNTNSHPPDMHHTSRTGSGSSNTNLASKCEQWITSRLAQAFAYLTDLHLSPSHPHALHEFIDWITRDILLEEAEEIAILVAGITTVTTGRKVGKDCPSAGIGVRDAAAANYGLSEDGQKAGMRKVEREIARVAGERYLGFMREFI